MICPNVKWNQKINKKYINKNNHNSINSNNHNNSNNININNHIIHINPTNQNRQYDNVILEITLKVLELITEWLAVLNDQIV